MGALMEASMQYVKTDLPVPDGRPNFTVVKVLFTSRVQGKRSFINKCIEDGPATDKMERSPSKTLSWFELLFGNVNILPIPTRWVKSMILTAREVRSAREVDPDGWCPFPFVIPPYDPNNWTIMKKGGDIYNFDSYVPALPADQFATARETIRLAIGLGARSPDIDFARLDISGIRLAIRQTFAALDITFYPREPLAAPDPPQEGGLQVPEVPVKDIEVPRKEEIKTVRKKIQDAIQLIGSTKIGSPIYHSDPLVVGLMEAHRLSRQFESENPVPPDRPGASEEETTFRIMVRAIRHLFVMAGLALDAAVTGEDIKDLAVFPFGYFDESTPPGGGGKGPPGGGNPRGGGGSRGNGGGGGGGRGGRGGQAGQGGRGGGGGGGSSSRGGHGGGRGDTPGRGSTPGGRGGRGGSGGGSGWSGVNSGSNRGGRGGGPSGTPFGRGGGGRGIPSPPGGGGAPIGRGGGGTSNSSGPSTPGGGAPLGRGGGAPYPPAGPAPPPAAGPSGFAPGSQGYLSIGEITDHRSVHDAWVVEPNSQAGFDVYNITGKYLPTPCLLAKSDGLTSSPKIS